MKYMKKTVTAILLAALLTSLTACGNEKKILESSKEEKTAVMTVDGHEVPMELYRYLALQYKASYGGSDNPDMWLGDSGAALLAELNEDVEESVIRLYTTISLCEDYGIKPDDAYIEDAVEITMDEIYEGYGYDYEAYAESIAAYNMNDSVYRFLMRNDILAEELMAKMIANGELPSGDDTLKSILMGDELIRVKQILVNDTTLTEEENRQLAEEALSRAVAGEDFDRLVNKYGDDWQMFNNTDGYYVSRGMFDKAFEEAAFALDIGEISMIVETEAGLSIIQRLEKDAGYIEKHFDTLADDYLRGLYNIILEKHEDTLTAEKLPKLDDYTIFNMTMSND
ncbi:MAG: peptidylprolyl isomerase [Clostridia bacterium]|nr:peptidylprolyl isomerase [Clostridia bacterium]